jgi:exopolyphosphatase / guanosine-5'-triphosphate,3'-diphosphate pyrophosphatase
MEADDEQGAEAPAAQLAPAIAQGLTDCAAAIQPLTFRSDTPTTPPTFDNGDRPRTFERTSEPGSERNGHAPTYGALDLGTNNCRLLVARPSRRGFLVVDAFSRIIRLGEGVSATGRLSDAAMHRTIEALKICEAKLRKANVARSRLIATQACRVAANGDEFLERVRRDVGLEIEVVCRETEARLAVSGCAALIDKHSDLALVFDIGGGSSELIWLDLNRRRDGWRRSMADRIEAQHCIAAWTSLPVGVVTIAERFGGRHVDEDAFETMVDFVTDLLAPFEREHGFRARMHNRRVHMLGTSGTVTTVAGIHLRLPRYDRNRVDGCWLRSSQVRTVTADLLARSYEARVREPCIGRDRADLVLAGCAILEALMRMWPCDMLRVADRGLREGILATLMTEDGVFRASRRDGWQ